MNNNCNACHSSASASGGVILDTYIGVKSQVDNGKLKGTINHDTGFKVMPPSGTKISECNLTIIDKWIADGAPNN
jgi:mono/diheme cytochrome c family protein